MVTLTESEYRERVYGVWLGKLIGSALGAPMDGEKRMHEVGAGAESLAGSRAEPEEWADFELAWLRAVQTAGPQLTPDDLIATWLKHIACAEGESAYARGNFRRGMRPPVSGAFNNPFRTALGAMARADLWGMLIPGDPEGAASRAAQDARLDHDGAGVEAAVALAAMVSAAFVESEVARLVEVGLKLVPEDSRLARASRDVVRWHGELANWRRTREMLLRAYSSEEVRDSTVAFGLIVLALLAGEGDLGRTVVTAASCGWSTKCTCAGAGAVVGAMLGASGIPADWRGAIREELRASPGLVGLPRTGRLGMLAEHTCEVGRLMIRSECAGRVQLSEEPSEEESKLATPEPTEFVRRLKMGPYVTSDRRGPLVIDIDYDARPTIGYDAPRRLAFGVTNAATRSVDLRTRISAPAGFVVTTNSDQITLPEGATVSFTATISAPKEHAQIAVTNPCTLFLSVEGGEEVTLPITLVGEGLWYAAGPYEDFEVGHSPEQPAVLSGEAAIDGEGWQRLSAAEPAVNLLTDLEGEQGTYYLATDVEAPRARRARLRVGCNDGTKVWLNGQEVFFQHEHRPVAPVSADEFEVELREGWNRLVIKMAQCSPRRLLSAVLKDLEGQLLVEAVNTSPRRV